MTREDAAYVVKPLGGKVTHYGNKVEGRLGARGYYKTMCNGRMQECTATQPTPNAVGASDSVTCKRCVKQADDRDIVYTGSAAMNSSI